MTDSEFCEDCKGTHRVRDKDGTIHPCFKCLSKGKMDQHNPNMKEASDFGLKL